MSGSFYREFEERHRGSRDLIQQRQRFYLPFLVPLQKIHESVKVVDLGCGRGEWLELLSAQGYEVEGIDLDEGMLAACRERNLRARKGDALDTLRSLPEASHSVISGFHIAEHIPFDTLQELFSEANRVLRPGGLLILETPNPENVAVSTNSFYLDPTHVRPIPPLLLEFLAEYSGFKRTKLVRLNGPTFTDVVPTLTDVLHHASPDYAVIAQKAAVADELALLDKEFAKEHGASLMQLSDAFDRQLSQALTKLQDLEEIESRVKQLECAAIDEKVQDLDRQLQTAMADIQHWRAQAEAGQRKINELTHSTSWRITMPLRVLNRAARRLAVDPRKLFSLGRRLLRAAAARARTFVIKRPALHARLREIISKNPSIHELLRRLSKTDIGPKHPVSGALSPTAELVIGELPQPCRAIYRRLGSALQQEERK